MNADNQTPRNTLIAALNDRLRIEGIGGRVLMTQGVHSLPENRREQLINAVRTYDAFSPDNDPYGEHDFGEVEIAGEAAMFKIDYYDLAGKHHSPDASDPTVTMRVMTLMLSFEY